MFEGVPQVLQGNARAAVDKRPMRAHVGCDEKFFRTASGVRLSSEISTHLAQEFHRHAELSSSVWRECQRFSRFWCNSLHVISTALCTGYAQP